MTVRVNKSSFNIREKLSELERPIGLKGSELMRSETIQEARDFIGAGRKNLLINGNFLIWQRSTDFDNPNGAWQYDAADRWLSNKGRCRQVTETIDGVSVKAMEISPSGGVYNGGRGFLQRVEDYTVYQKQTVLSAYVKASAPSEVEFGRLYEGTSGTTVPGKTINITTEFQRFEIVNPIVSFAAPGDNYIVSGLDNGVTYTVANVQLEFGKVATDFEHRSYGEELALCQRY
jgi:hypothetical protein